MQNVVSNMFNEIEGQFACNNGFEIIYAILEYERNKIYKSTLVSPF